jgi:hypothetical protein
VALELVGDRMIGGPAGGPAEDLAARGDGGRNAIGKPRDQLELSVVTPGVAAIDLGERVVAAAVAGVVHGVDPEPVIAEDLRRCGVADEAGGPAHPLAHLERAPIRLHRLDVLNDWQYRQFCIELSRKGFREREPDGLTERETSQVLAKAFDELRSAGMTRGDVARALHLPTSELEGLLFGLTISAVDGEATSPSKPRGQLRLVR